MTDPIHQPIQPQPPPWVVKFRSRAEATARKIARVHLPSYISYGVIGLAALCSSIVVQFSDLNVAYWTRYNYMKDDLPWVEPLYAHFVTENQLYGRIVKQSRSCLLYRDIGTCVGAIVGAVLFSEKLAGSKFQMPRVFRGVYGAALGAAVGRFATPIVPSMKYNQVERNVANLSFLEFLLEVGPPEQHVELKNWLACYHSTFPMGEKAHHIQLPEPERDQWMGEVYKQPLTQQSPILQPAFNNGRRTSTQH